MKCTHRNESKYARVAHFAQNKQNHGNYATTAKIWALMFISLLFYTCNRITRKYRYKQISLQYKTDEYNPHYKMKYCKQFQLNFEIALKTHVMPWQPNGFLFSYVFKVCFKITIYYSYIILNSSLPMGDAHFAALAHFAPLSPIFTL